MNDLRRASGPLRLPILAVGGLLAFFLALPMLIVVPTSWTRNPEIRRISRFAACDGHRRSRPSWRS